MTIIDFIKQTFAGTKNSVDNSKFPVEIHSFYLPEEGTVEFANWKKPSFPDVLLTQREVNFFKKLIPKGSLAIEIGAGVGDKTIPIALAAGTEGRVIAIEQDEQSFKILETNSRLNIEKTKIAALRYTVTEEQVSDDSKIDLQNYLENQIADWLPKISLIKSTYEKANQAIIESSTNILSKYQPSLILKIFKSHTAELRAQTFRYLESLGYKLYFISDFDETADIEILTDAAPGKKEEYFFVATTKTIFEAP